MRPRPSSLFTKYEWRVGRSLGRTIYAMVGYDREADVFVGIMETRELAAAVVKTHNEAIQEEK